MRLTSIRQRLLIWFLLLSLLPVLLIAYSLEQAFERELERNTTQYIATIADKKYDQINDYLDALKHNVKINAQGGMVADAVLAFSQEAARSGVTSDGYRQLDEQYREYFRRILEDSDYYDLFLISRYGTVVYSQKHEADFGSNLYSGSYRETGLAKVVRNSAATLESGISEFELYSPSDEKPALFVSVPVIVKNRVAGFFAIQVDHKKMFDVLTDRTGLGETGETVVVRREQQNALLMAPLLSNPDAALKQTIPLTDNADLLLHKALNGERGSGYKDDFRGVPVIAAWRYLPQTRWGMVVKIDAAEALAPLYRLRQISMVLSVLIIGLIVIGALLLARQLTVPLTRISQRANDIASGKFEQRLSVVGQDELAQLALSFNVMTERLQASYAGLEEQVKQRTAELSQSLNSLRVKDAALSSSINAIAIVDLDNRISFVNPAFMRLLHLPAAMQVHGVLINELLGKAMNISHIRDALQKDGYWIGDLRIHPAVADALDVQLSASMVRDEAGKHLCMLYSFVDITTQKQAEQALLAAKKAAEEASQSKSKFLANMSHEIRTPMNAILGLTQLVLDTDLNSSQQDFLKKVHTSARALLGVLNDILDFSKIEADQMSIEQVQFHLEDTLVQLSDLFSAVVHEKGIELFFDITPDLPAQIVTDPLRLSQVLTNLVSNSVKFTQQGEIHIKVEVASRNKDVAILRFEVRDTGIGMTQAQLGRLFQAFSQADESTTRKYGGTGLGLSISQRLVRLMGGDITASAEVGQGTSFVFTIQVRVVDDPKLRVSAQKLSGLNVLVVDDHETSRLILSKLLHSWSISVVTASSGEEALLKLQHKQLDVLLLDWCMPNMDGLELARHIEALAKQGKLRNPLKVFMVTAHDKDKLLRQAGDMRLAGVLSKPIIPSQLFNTLLECRYPHATAALRQQQEPQHQHNVLQGMRILLVEDNQINRIMASEFLQRRGVLLKLARDGNEAIDSVKKQTFDAVLMDLHMPGMDGLEATKYIRQLPQGQNLPIIAMTAAVMQEDIDRCTNAGMNGFIAKPIDPDNVVSTLLKCVRTRSQNMTDGVSVSFDAQDILLPDNLPHFDLSGPLRRVDNNRVLLVKLLLGFAQDHSDTEKKVNTLVAAGDTKQLILILHSLKGVSANLGATRLSEITRQWEFELKTGLNSTCHAAFCTALKETLLSIQNNIKLPAPITVNASVDLVALSAVLNRLVPYLQHQEILPEDLLEQLYQFARVNSTHVAFAQLIRQLDDFDYVSALQTLKDLANSLGVVLDSV